MILIGWQWWQAPSAIALAVTSSPSTLAHPPIPTLVVVATDRRSYLADIDWNSGSAPSLPIPRYQTSSTTSSF